MTNTSTGDISRLPRWARNKIERLEREIVQLQDNLSVLEGAIGVKENSLDIDTEVWIWKFDRSIPLPKGSTIIFGDPEDTRHFSVELRSDGEVNVRSGWGALDIRPEVSNSIRIAHRER